jgi:CubicO group peptidase (beta-lactamase class C family)
VSSSPAAFVERCLRDEGGRGSATRVVGVISGETQTVITARPRTTPQRDDGEPLFEIGSLTKVLTATLLADLHLRGEIGLGDPLTRHLTEAQIPRWDGRAPTLEELATHRAALPNTPPPLARRELLAAAGVLRGDPWEGVGDDDYRRMLRAMRPRRPPGGRVRYSSIGFGLLGDALARHAGTSYEALLHERICRPLGMADTVVDAGARGGLLEGRSRRGAPRPPLRDCMPAAGSVRSTAPDLLRFLRACLRPPPDEPLGAALALAQQPRAKINRHLSVGLGWLVLRRGEDRTVVWHNGGTWGFRSFAALVPRRQVAVVVLSNTARSVDRLGFTIVERVAAIAPGADRAATGR